MRDRKPRSYSYRIPLDKTKPVFCISRYQRSHDEYNINKLSRRDVPNWGAAKNIGVVFYQSTETWNYEKGEYEGGAIPGLGEYRYSLEWERTPETELLEMKRHHKGGTKIRGEQFYGTHEPQLSDYVPVETTVPWTPGEIRDMFDGEEVPNRVDYLQDHPMMDAKDARFEFREYIEEAKREGARKQERALEEYRDNCDHDHAIETTRGGYCEDCGKQWEDERVMEDDEVTIVGSA